MLLKSSELASSLWDVRTFLYLTTLSTSNQESFHPLVLIMHFLHITKMFGVQSFYQLWVEFKFRVLEKLCTSKNYKCRNRNVLNSSLFTCDEQKKKTVCFLHLYFMIHPTCVLFTLIFNFHFLRVADVAERQLFRLFSFFIVSNHPSFLSNFLLILLKRHVLILLDVHFLC